MSAISKIEWTDRTWNPVRGCSIVSPGCVNCYAMKQAHRFSGPGKPYEGLTKQTSAGPQWTGVVRMAPDRTVDEPLSWRTPQRIFVNSMSDLFHEGVSFEQIAEVFHVMYGEASAVPSPRHTYQILTKRPERMYRWFQWLATYKGDDATILALSTYLVMQGPHPRVWLGISAEDQPRFEERIPWLLRTPAAVRFISAEPLLAPINLHQALCSHANPSRPEQRVSRICGRPMVDWVITGGESGPGARPCWVEWLTSIVRQCQLTGVPVFVKQLGSKPLVEAGRLRHWEWRHLHEERRFLPTDKILPSTSPWRVNLKDRKGGDPSEWPEGLRVREFPAPK